MALINIDSIKNTGLKNPKIVSEEKSFFDFLNKDIAIFSSGFSDIKKEKFYSGLCILLEAGVDVRTALELLEEGQTKQKDKELISNIKNSIVKGSDLAQAIKNENVFSDYEFYSIKLGEESGRIIEVLNDLSNFFNKKIQQKRQLISALSYPTIVFAASFGAIYFMMSFVVPMFSDVFKRFKGELPYFTQLIIKVSNTFSNYSLLIILIPFSVFIFFFANRKKEWFRNYGSKLVQKIPLMNQMIQKIYLARFCQSMNLLLGAKTSLVVSLDLASKMVQFYPIEKALQLIESQILKGKSLHECLANFPIFSRQMVSLIKVAEEVNQLDLMFGKLAKQYSQEVEYQTNTMSNLIEPIMILFLGTLVAIILVAIYLPLFQMGSTIG